MKVGSYSCHWIIGALFALSSGLGSQAFAADNGTSPACGADADGTLVLTFDAALGKENFDFDPRKCVFDPAKSVRLVIVHVNTFTEKYSVSTNATDYHNLSVPSALKDLIITQPPSQGPLKPGAILPLQSAFAPAITLPRPEKRASKKELNDDLDDFNKKLAQYREITKLTVNDVMTYIRFGSTNRDIRSGVAAEIKQQLAGNATIGADADAVLTYANSDSTDGYPRVATSIRKVAVEWVKAFEDSMRELKDARNKWNVDFSHFDTQRDHSFDQHNAHITQSMSDINFESAAKDRSVIANLYATVLDPSVAPLTLTKDLGKADGDQISIIVQVDHVVPSYLQIDASNEKNPVNSVATPDASVGTKSFQVSAPTRNRWVLDYSFGFASTNLRQVNYYLDSAKIIRQGNSDTSAFSIAAFAHVYPTRLVQLADAEYLTFGGTVGISGNTTQPAYLGGLSAILEMGPKIRVSLSRGFAWGRVAELNGDAVGAAPVNGTSINTATHMKRGNFWGLSFVFGF